MNALCTAHCTVSLAGLSKKSGFAKDTSQFETWGEVMMVCEAGKFL